MPDTIRSAITGQEITAEQKHVEEIAQNLLNNEIYCCDSSLVDDMLKLEGSGFSIDDIQGVYADPSDWTVDQCRDYLNDYGIRKQPDDPRDLDRETCVELLESVGIECRDEETVETLRVAVESNIDDETLDGLDDWRDAVRDNAEPREIYEWWRVSKWLAEKLHEIDQPTLENDYGYWWGRTCTGQAILMDRTLQDVARNIL
jgi:hypothetical protein